MSVSLTAAEEAAVAEARALIERRAARHSHAAVVLTRDGGTFSGVGRPCPRPTRGTPSTAGADVTEFYKPDPRVFRLAIEALRAGGVEPAEAIYVGDSLADHAAAVGAGLHFLGVTTGLVSGPQFERAGATFVSRLDEAISAR